MIVFNVNHFEKILYLKIYVNLVQVGIIYQIRDVNYAHQLLVIVRSAKIQVFGKSVKWAIIYNIINILLIDTQSNSSLCPSKCFECRSYDYCTKCEDGYYSNETVINQKTSCNVCPQKLYQMQKFKLMYQMCFRIF
ncbi:unnamed protein product [Paramecium sonneborni]|uniref:Uncharacterized protein n=1 Tax=Paramecium sonneborni TaxID=65129 RepID=A0A8S1RD05_9CILI|nr:unnamed protein product [Paramecium sonneborni]